MALCFRMMKAWKMVVGMFHLCLINNMYPLCSLGKLEEEFEKKFNSLPQYSPLTFDKKSTVVTKKKTDISTAPEEQPLKPAKGEQKMSPECSPKVSICFNRSRHSPFPSIPHTAHVAPHFQKLDHSLMTKKNTLLPFNIACHSLVSFCFFFVISGPSPSQKNTLFHKIVSKYKDKKEKPNTLDKGELEHHVM